MELFAGAGGLLTAFGEAGFRHVLAVENDPAAVGSAAGERGGFL